MLHSIYTKLRIKAISKEAQGFKVIVFEDGHGLDYKAGQYITLVKTRSDGEVRRSYSIISTPASQEPLSIGVKRIDNGFFSRYLVDNAKVGETILTIGTGGFFTLPDKITNCRQIFFFAAGSGITPVMSLIKTALRDYQHLKLVLIYSNSSLEQTAFLNELNILRELYPEHLYLELLFSDNPQLIKARLHRELIFAIIEERLIDNRNNTLCYVCGPENFMRLCIYSLTEAGIPQLNIKRENFAIGTPPKILLKPPDKEAHTVYLRHSDGSVVNLTVHYPDTILQAAKRAHVILPYSCETGRCGSCVAQCVKGEVWHSYNEVLTDAELQKGLVLTCVGHPVNGDVELKL